MPLDPAQRAQFDRFAKLARIEFEKGYAKWDAAAVARWWDKWCQNGRTHHDRLGWILMHCTGVRPWKGNPNARPYLFD